MIHSAIETALQIFIVVMAFQSDSGVYHTEKMHYAFTDEARCEEFAREVLSNHYKRINGLYWYCDELEVNP